MSQVRLTIVCSGDVRAAPNVTKALSGAGFACADNKEMKDPAWGLASYTDPLTAEKAGHPNSGHTPGSGHPAELHYLVLPGDHSHLAACAETCDHLGRTEPRPHECQYTDQPYETDPRIGFVTATVECSDDVKTMSGFVDKAQALATAQRWQVRLHFAALPQVAVVDTPLPESISHADRLARIEADVAILRAIEGVQP